MNQAQAAFSNFISTFDSLYDTYFPLVTKQMKAKSLLKPWVTITPTNRIKSRGIRRQGCIH